MSIPKIFITWLLNWELLACLCKFDPVFLWSLANFNSFYIWVQSFICVFALESVNFSFKSVNLAFPNFVFLHWKLSSHCISSALLFCCNLLSNFIKASVVFFLAKPQCKIKFSFTNHKLNFFSQQEISLRQKYFALSICWLIQQLLHTTQLMLRNREQILLSSLLANQKLVPHYIRHFLRDVLIISQKLVLNRSQVQRILPSKNILTFRRQPFPMQSQWHHKVSDGFSNVLFFLSFASILLQNTEHMEDFV